MGTPGRVWMATVLVGARAFAQPAAPPPPDAGEAQPDASPTDAAPEPAHVEPTPPAPPPPPPPVPPPPPERIVVHEQELDTTNMFLIGGAGAGIAAALCLALAGHEASGDAATATLYKDYADISARSTRLYVASGISAAVGLGLAVTALVRIRSANETTSGVAITPRAGGASIVWEGSWW